MAMRIGFSAAVRCILALSITLGSLSVGFTRERGPRVEVVCPAPPIPVNVGEQNLIAYELHITNFDMVSLKLERLTVFANHSADQTLKSYSGGELAGLMSMASSMGGGKDSQVIAPGSRAIVFLWLEIGADKPALKSLGHQMIFSTVTQGDASAAKTEAKLEDFEVAVRREAVPTVRAPFDGGVWLAGELANDAGHRRTEAAIDGHVHAPERFAIDWVKVGPNGDSHHDGNARNENWWGYGEPIHAVADGEVTQVVDGIAENTPRVLPLPVTLDNIAGNCVIVRIAGNRYVTYAHLQNGSITVRVHDHVRQGAILGKLGNSGQSTAAHLHMQITDGNSVLESEGMPFVFTNYTDLGPGSEYELDKHRSIPRSGALPVGNLVVEFRGAQ